MLRRLVKCRHNIKWLINMGKEKVQLTRSENSEQQKNGLFPNFIEFKWKTGLAAINQLSCPMMIMGRDQIHPKLIQKQHKSQMLMWYMSFPSKQNVKIPKKRLVPIHLDEFRYCHSLTTCFTAYSSYSMHRLAENVHKEANIEYAWYPIYFQKCKQILRAPSEKESKY